MWATFATKAQKQLYMKFVCKFFYRFSDSSKPSQSVLLIYELAWLAGIHKSDENFNLLKTPCKVAHVTEVASC